jgi:PAS domain S-box-containing protein
MARTSGKLPRRGAQGRRAPAAPPEPRRPKAASTDESASRRPGAARRSYPLVTPSDVLSAMIAFSREVTAETQEEELFRLLHHTLHEMLPGRLIAVRIVDPRSLEVAELLGDPGLTEDAGRLPAMINRGALEYPNVRLNLPDNLQARDGSTRTIEVVDEHPLIFRGADAGFFVPLVAGGEFTGEVHVNYRPLPGARGARDYPRRADKGLVIPIANHVAVVAHTRRLLRETAYLQDYLEQLIDQANVLILATDVQGRITVWNRAIHRMTGYPRGHAIGRQLLAWATELGAPDIGRVIKQVAASGEAATREVWLPTEGGAVLRAAFNVVTVRDHQGRTAAVLAIGQDVTAMRHLQNQIVHAEKLATVGQIAAGVAHEINNPLTSIQVCASTLLRKAALAAQGKADNIFDAADVDRVRMIQEGSERIRRFARDLVSYARPSGSEVEPLSVNDVILQALSFCEHVIDDARATVERDLAADLPLIQAIRDQILQVVINLVTNACHALEKQGGVLRVRTWSTGGASVGFAVSDSGIGIRDEDRAKVFDPFFTTKPAGRGTGLGLSVVRNIVYAHGGQISFQSRPGSGTTFMVTLPLTAMGPQTAEGEAPRI